MAGIACDDTTMDGTTMLPNVLSILRDRSHASRQVLQKPAIADEYVQQSKSKVFTDKHIIVQRIENSILCKNYFAKGARRRKQEQFYSEHT